MLFSGREEQNAFMIEMDNAAWYAVFRDIGVNQEVLGEMHFHHVSNKRFF